MGIIFFSYSDFFSIFLRHRWSITIRQTSVRSFDFHAVYSKDVIVWVSHLTNRAYHPSLIN